VHWVISFKHATNLSQKVVDKKMIEYFNISLGRWYFHLALLILLYLIINWIVDKFIKKRVLKMIVSFTSSIILTPIVYSLFVAFLFSFLFYESHPELKFSSTAWAENKKERHHMKKNLIENKFLFGKTKNKIIKILGRPQKNFEVGLDTSKNWNYSMGSEGHGMGWKFHSLSVHFKDGKVAAVKTSEFID
jgi:hypothetical protein